MSVLFLNSTVWFELLAGTWPFEGLPAESIIKMVGSGKKQDISQIQVGKVREQISILVYRCSVRQNDCWPF